MRGNDGSRRGRRGGAEDAEAPRSVLIALGALVSDLAAGRYDEIARDGRAGRIAPTDMRRVIVDYGRTPISPPTLEAVAESLHAFALDHEQNAWAIDAPLWTREEGRSDLEVFVRARLTPSGVHIEMEDLRVP